MAKGDRNVGWPGFFRAFTVLCAIILLLSRAGMEQLGQGNQVLQVYEGLTLWAIPALFMLWGMTALEEVKTGTLPALSGLALPAFGALVFWGGGVCCSCPSAGRRCPELGRNMGGLGIGRPWEYLCSPLVYPTPA